MLVGHDLLFNGTGLGPADILYSERTLKYGSVCIQLRMVNSLVKALTVESTDDELVPGLCENVVDVFVDHSS